MSTLYCSTCRLTLIWSNTLFMWQWHPAFIWYHFDDVSLTLCDHFFSVNMHSVRLQHCGHCWKAHTGSALEQFDPFSFIGPTGHTALDWLKLQSFTRFSHGVLKDFCCWDGMRNKSAAFFCLLFLVRCTSAGSVLHLRGGLGRQDEGSIVSREGLYCKVRHQFSLPT